MTKKSKRVAIYARVSTSGQTTENQLNQLRDVAKRHTWDITKEYVDNGVSGAKGRDKRPGFDSMCKDATRKEFDLIMAWSVDRIGRSLSHLVTFLDEIKSKDIGLYLHVQGLDTSTPSGKAMFQMIGVFAEFERAMIRERVHAGLERAKSKGIKLGRREISSIVKRNIIKERAKGKSIRDIAEITGTSVGLVHKTIEQYK